MKYLRRLVGAIDRWQRRTPWAGATYGVTKKFGDDKANLYVVSLAWYGFTAIFPLLLAIVTIFGFIGEKSLGSGIIDTLHKFPVIGQNFNPSSGDTLKGSGFGLAVGLLGLIYGAQGVTQTAEQAMMSVWAVPPDERPSFLPKLGRSLSALFLIGLAFVLNASITSYVTGGTSNYAIRVPVIAGLVLLNVALYFVTFDALTPKSVRSRGLLPGSVLAGFGFTLLITVGTGLMNHQLRHASATYGAFGSVIGLVSFLLLLAKLTMYAAELNPVLERRLYPRALPMGLEPTPADRRVPYDIAIARGMPADASSR